MWVLKSYILQKVNFTLCKLKVLKKYSDLQGKVITPLHREAKLPTQDQHVVCG